MFASVLSSVVRVSDAAHTTTLLIDVVGHTYRVELNSTPNGRSFYVHAGRRTKRANTCTTTARLILRRELRRNGLARAPKADAVASLATLIKDGIVAARLAHVDEQELVEAMRELRELRQAQAWGREHIYAGVCGEDDARDDRIASLEAFIYGNDATWHTGG